MKDGGPQGAGDLSFAITERNRVRRMHQNGSYSLVRLFAVLDASPPSDIGYVIDEQPFVNRTFALNLMMNHDGPEARTSSDGYHCPRTGGTDSCRKSATRDQIAEMPTLSAGPPHLAVVAVARGD